MGREGGGQGGLDDVAIALQRIAFLLVPFMRLPPEHIQGANGTSTEADRDTQDSMDGGVGQVSGQQRPTGISVQISSRDWGIGDVRVGAGPLLGVHLGVLEQAPVGVAGDGVAEVVVVVHEHDAAPVDAKQVQAGVADGGERSDQVVVGIGCGESPQTGFQMTAIDTHQLLPLLASPGPSWHWRPRPADLDDSRRNQ
jgi:hypothetical protein